MRISRPLSPEQRERRRLRERARYHALTPEERKARLEKRRLYNSKTYRKLTEQEKASLRLRARLKYEQQADPLKAASVAVALRREAAVLERDAALMMQEAQRLRQKAAKVLEMPTAYAAKQRARKF